MFLNLESNEGSQDVVFFLFVKAYGQLEHWNGEGGGFVLCVVWQPIIHMPPRSLAV